MDIPIPKIPTDNLYKFAAITGSLFLVIGLIIVPIAGYISRGEYINTRIERVKDSLNFIVAKNKLKYFHKYDTLEDLIEESKLLLQNHKLDRDTDLIKLQKAERWNELIMKRTIRDDSLFNTFTSKIRLENDSFKFYTSEFILDHFLWITILFSFGGFFLASWGFSNWYNKLQKPMDLWYENQAISPDEKNKSAETKGEHGDNVQNM